MSNDKWDLVEMESTILFSLIKGRWTLRTRSVETQIFDFHWVLSSILIHLVVFESSYETVYYNRGGSG